jgi:tagatose-1,6-bisphosphate aldolase
LRYGVAQSIASGALQGKTGLIVTIEQSPGYGAGETIARRTVLVKGWNASKVRKIGASAVKLLVYYHPESKTAKDQEALVSQVAEDCKINDIPLVLEVLTHPIVEGNPKISSFCRTTSSHYHRIRKTVMPFRRRCFQSRVSRRCEV